MAWLGRDRHLAFLRVPSLGARRRFGVPSLVGPTARGGLRRIRSGPGGVSSRAPPEVFARYSEVALSLVAAPEDILCWHVTVSAVTTRAAP